MIGYRRRSVNNSFGTKRNSSLKAKDLYLSAVNFPAPAGKVSIISVQAFSRLISMKRIIRTMSKEDVKAFYLHVLDLWDANKQPYSDAYVKEMLAMLRSIFFEYSPADIPNFPKHTVIPKKEKQSLGIERQIKTEPHIPAKISPRNLDTSDYRDEGR